MARGVPDCPEASPSGKCGTHTTLHTMERSCRGGTPKTEPGRARGAEWGEEGTRANFPIWPTWERWSPHPPQERPWVPLCPPADSAPPPSPKAASPLPVPLPEEVILVAGLQQPGADRCGDNGHTPRK